MKKKFVYILWLCLLLAHSVNGYGLTTRKLDYIGMPVGGICTGQVYLGGDGQLWNWDIFNIATTNPGVSGDRFYLNPMQQSQRFINGFGIVVQNAGKTYKRLLNAKGFSDIKFQGEYPIGKIRYLDRQLPVEVNLQAYSPFIPTDEDNSGLPAIVMEYEVRNMTDDDLHVEVSGWIQNMSSYQSASSAKGKHTNTVITTEQFGGVVLSSDETLSNNYPDWGSMALVLLDPKAVSSPNCVEDLGTGFFDGSSSKQSAEVSLGCQLVGGVRRMVDLKKGETHTFTFLVTWHFPNIHLWNAAPRWKGIENLRHYYSGRFKDAQDVARYIAHHQELLAATKQWNKTWYDSSLPVDFLDRTFANVSTLATTATVRLDDVKDTPENEGRYYNFEGVYLGEGTCRHVSHYGQVLGRVFPALARHHRQQIDLGLSLTPEGVIQYRGEMSHQGRHDGRGYAADGQAGTILGVYREHLMAPDNSFLRTNWNKVKQAMLYMIRHDKGLDVEGENFKHSNEADGILEGIQYNTLDRMWYGKIPWISGLYNAALLATAEMADIMGERTFAKECRKIAQKGSDYLSTHLFNGEYFVQELDSLHLDAPNTNQGCHVDQLLGQYWASQLNLGYVVPKELVQRTLQSIMKYNYVTDYAEFLCHSPIPVSRWYAGRDEQGVVNCTFPHGGDNIAPGHIQNDWEKLVVGYFSEIFTGQEHAIAATLFSEGMTDEAMKVEQAINDRYAATKRNPYNEIEYGNHYTRAMSSFAAYIAATGYFYDGPRGIISFSPVWKKENFKSAFIVSEGWGTYQQELKETENFQLRLNYGTLKLQSVFLPSQLERVKHAMVTFNSKPIKFKLKRNNNKLSVQLHQIEMSEGDELIIRLIP